MADDDKGQLSLTLGEAAKAAWSQLNKMGKSLENTAAQRAKEAAAHEAADAARERVVDKKVSIAMKNNDFGDNLMQVTTEQDKAWCDGKQMIVSGQDGIFVAKLDDKGKLTVSECQFDGNLSLGNYELSGKNLKNKLDRFGELDVEFGIDYEARYDNSAKAFKEALNKAILQSHEAAAERTPSRDNSQQAVTTR